MYMRMSWSIKEIFTLPVDWYKFRAQRKAWWITCEARIYLNQHLMKSLTVTLMVRTSAPACLSFANFTPHKRESPLTQLCALRLMDLIIGGTVKNGERRALIAFCGGGERNKNSHTHLRIAIIYWISATRPIGPHRYCSFLSCAPFYLAPRRVSTHRYFREKL
jgi:hypothetical protein